MAKQGRPTKYNDDLANEICSTLSASVEGIEQLCKKHDHWPAVATVYKWKFIHSSFKDKYDEARRNQIDLQADRLDQLHNEIPTFIDEKGIERIDSGMLGKYKLLSDNRKWVASKLAPKVWGDKQQVSLEETSNTEELKAEILKLRAELEAEKKRDY